MTDRTRTARDAGTPDVTRRAGHAPAAPGRPPAARRMLRVAPLVFALALALPGPAPLEAAFIRGDVNEDGRVSLVDPVFLLASLFAGGAPPGCWDSADVDDDGAVDLADAVALLDFLFLGSAPPAAPYPDPGLDPTADAYECPSLDLLLAPAASRYPVGTQVQVTIFNDTGATQTLSIEQGAAASGGLTDATFAGGAASVTVGDGEIATVTLETGTAGSATVAPPGTVKLMDGSDVLASFPVYALSVESLAFDTTTDNLTDAVEFRLGEYTDILVPEYLAGVRNQPALYVQGTTPSIDVTIALQPADLSLDCTVEATGGGALGPVAAGALSVAGGSGSVTLPLAQAIPDGLAQHDIVWSWQAVAEGFDCELGDTAHTIYTVLDVPHSPWQPTPSGGLRQPREDAMEALIDFAGGSLTLQEMREGVVQGAYDVPSFTYDTVSGAPGFGYWAGNTFNFDLTTYLSSGYGGTGSVIGCCYDACAIMVCFSNLAGDDLTYLYSGGYFGYLNCADLIGSAAISNNPFYTGWWARSDPICAQDGSASSCNRNGFGNHTFAGDGTGASAVIYDLTCMFDLDSNPDTTAVWPEGITASTLLTATVLTDAGAGWIDDTFAGLTLRPEVDTTTPDPYAEFSILTNDFETITVASGSMTPSAGTGDHYEVFDHVSPAIDMQYCTGWPWSEYVQICVDDVPATSTQTPSTRTLMIY